MSTHTISQEHPIADIVTTVPALLPVTIEQIASRIFEGFSDRFKERLNGRQERALKLAVEGHVCHKSERIFSVRSEDNKRTYLVDLERGICTCPDCKKGHVCKHRIAAYLIEQAQKAGQPVQASAEPELSQVEKARFLLGAQSDLLREAVIYASVNLDTQLVDVEVISIEGEVAVVRALPRYQDGKSVPQFPFEGKCSWTKVLAKSLVNIMIYR